MRPLAAPLTALLLVAALPAGASAQSLGFGTAGGQPAPIDITAQNGISWNQKTRIVTAKGNARAVRGKVTVTADELVAHYSPKPASGAAKPTPAAKPDASAGGLGGLDSGASQITQLDAVGHVHIFTATEQAFGDLAVYHMARHELVLTGGNLRLITPTETVTATRALQYWSEARKAVAIGHAKVVGKDGRSVTADRLTGYFTAAPAAPKAGGTPPAGSTAEASQLRKVVAEGHVVVTTQTDVATGDHGVYHPATGIAVLTGNVHITHGPNELAGHIAQVNMKTGVATLVSAPGHRVEGLILPDSAPAAKPGAAKSPQSGARAK
ncbi:MULTISPECIES: LptA/OstA family protein [Acidiphilium]|jgi:lipopolysaccharide export system protein LptA|uniref:OstA family protein n=2 Tax=Bacteria TaxID=2 RepID=A5FZ45_ACICJ|nr:MULTISPECIES: LptA/OstA family protein [Acidiphilium]ABQ30877.1 OstA family protein [Acidiphilium cryptum JF-5]EGO96404.1 OstA family protein [Acidiphilium sp. PM]KDM66988.1 OstA family protein [Acidiphilium sp. JA12-A1]MBU6356624.1 organic solvent tolerance protein OstA [Rhodospirillales bacterium]